MKVLITGANGFVGAALLREMSSRDNFSVSGTVRRLTGVIDEMDVPVAAVELTPQTDWSAMLSNVDVVVHTAARVHIMNDDASYSFAEFRQINVEGTMSLARQAAAMGVCRFVFISSAKVNGEVTLPGKPFTTEDVPAPRGAYAQSKLDAELALVDLANETGMDIVIIRPPLVYGPGVKGNFATMAWWVKRGLPLPFGSVRNERSMVALENLVDFVLLCADPRQSPGAANQVFFISDGEDVSTNLLLRKLAHAIGRSSRLLPIPPNLLRYLAVLVGNKSVPERLLDNLQVDISKTRSLLSWKPVVSMDDQLSKMFN
jgi:nucleoside-diphosphate-sugar epimerase